MNKIKPYLDKTKLSRKTQ